MGQMGESITHGKQAFDRCVMDLGRILVETIMYMEREEMAGTAYRPTDRDLKKWASPAFLTELKCLSLSEKNDGI